MITLTSFVNPQTEVLKREERAFNFQKGSAQSPIPRLSLKIDPSRLWRDIIKTSKFGGAPGTTAINRLSLSDADRQVRDWFVAEAKSLNLEVIVDDMGNIFAVLPGQNLSLPPIGMGSHLDTQPNGILLPGAS